MSPTPTQFTIEVSVQHYYPGNYYLGFTVMEEDFSSADVIGPNINSIQQLPQQPDYILALL